MKTLAIALGFLGLCGLFALEMLLAMNANVAYGVIIFRTALLVHAFWERQ